MSSRYDAVVAGGGLSGLSLAAQLATQGWGDRRVLVVDDATRPPPAVCWGSWSDRPGLLDAAASRSYGQVRVHAGGTSRVLPLDPYRYRVVYRGDLQRVVIGLLGRCPGFELRQGRIEQLHDRGDAAEVTVDGQPVRASWAFDSMTRPPSGTEADACLAFTGWQVRCGRPVFDPDVPTLFDFRTPQAGGARFVYVLPDDPYHALVEVTEFVPRRAAPPTPAERSAALFTYLHDVLGVAEYDVLRTESAVLPLRVHPPERGRGRVIPIGARGGLIKATTGYAYERIQRDSEAIARSLARRGHPFGTPPLPRRFRLLDAVLLDVLDREPARLEQAFDRLFSANPARRVLRFLDEDTGLADELHVIASLPPVPYLRAAAHVLGTSVIR